MLKRCTDARIKPSEEKESGKAGARVLMTLPAPADGRLRRQPTNPKHGSLKPRTREIISLYNGLSADKTSSEPGILKCFSNNPFLRGAVNHPTRQQDVQICINKGSGVGGGMRGTPLGTAGSHLGQDRASAWLDAPGWNVCFRYGASARGEPEGPDLAALEPRAFERLWRSSRY